jgi:hypothetical protein
LGIISLFRSSWYNHDINRRGRRVNKPWIEKTSTEDLKNSEFGLRPLRAVGSLYEPEASIPSFHVGGIKPLTLKDA